MIVGHLSDKETYQPLLTEPVWQQAFNWLEKYQTNPPDDGEYKIAGSNIRAIVQTATPTPRDDRVFEAHQREIDLHYCFTGSEIIEWAPVSSLTAQTEYNTERDFTLYNLPSQATSLYMTPNTFAIFFPADAHLPTLPAKHSEVRKTVIKINTSLL